MRLLLRRVQKTSRQRRSESRFTMAVLMQMALPDSWACHTLRIRGPGKPLQSWPSSVSTLAAQTQTGPPPPFCAG